MTKQRERINQSLEHIKKDLPGNFNPKTAVIGEKDWNIYGEIVMLSEWKCESIPPFNIPEPGNEGIYKETGSIVAGRLEGKDILVSKGRFHYYDGVSMRDIGHIIYLFKLLGIENILSLDEAGTLHPRHKTGELALIYDHINLAGDNPLIGENDYELGVRFPDMSNAYDREQFSKIYSVFADKKMRVNESVCVGAIGPEGETEAEARFYREIGGDAVTYNLVSENIAAVHGGLKFSAIAFLTRELIADKMMEDERTYKQAEEERKQNLVKCETQLGKILKDIIKIL